MTTATTQLRSDQQTRVDRARAVLAEQSPSMYELADMAGRIGVLEWHLEELLALVAELSRAGELVRAPILKIGPWDHFGAGTNRHHMLTPEAPAAFPQASACNRPKGGK